MGIEPTTSGLDLPLLCRLSYEVGQRKSGTIKVVNPGEEIYMYLYFWDSALFPWQPCFLRHNYPYSECFHSILFFINVFKFLKTNSCWRLFIPLVPLVLSFNSVIIGKTIFWLHGIVMKSILVISIWRMFWNFRHSNVTCLQSWLFAFIRILSLEFFSPSLGGNKISDLTMAHSRGAFSFKFWS